MMGTMKLSEQENRTPDYHHNRRPLFKTQAVRRHPTVNQRQKAERLAVSIETKEELNAQRGKMKLMHARREKTPCKQS